MPLEKIEHDLKKKKKKSFPRGSVSVQDQANSGSPFTSFFDKSEFSF